MGRHNNSCTVGRRFREQRNETIAAGCVKTDKRFVDQEQLEGSHEADSERRLLTKPATERCWKVVGTMLKAEASE